METLDKKKILFVITKSNWGGAQAYVYTLASHLKKTGADIAVALGGIGEADAHTGLLAEKLALAGIRTLFVKSFMREVSFMREFKVLGELKRIFKQEKPDVVHLNSSKAGGIGAFASRLSGVSRIVFTSHGLAYDEDKDPLTRLFRWFATWATFLLAHHIILISKNTYERARRFPFCKGKMSLVYNGIPAIPLIPKMEARLKLIPTGNTDVLWIGTISELTRNKGLSYLIEAAHILKERGHSFELGIIGTEGRERGLLTDLIAKYQLSKEVHLLGFVAHAARYLSAFDIFTLTSVKEGHPYVLLEAAQARCTVVGSRIPGITDIIDNTTGILTPPKNPAAIATALGTLFRDHTRRTELGNNLQTRVVKKFSIEKMLEKTVAVYI